MGENKIFKAILGKKVGMTQLFDTKGHFIPVTVIEAGPCPVIQKKSIEKEGYSAVQIGFGKVKIKNLTKPILTHFAKSGSEPVRFLREIRVADEKEIAELNPGDMLTLGGFKEGDFVKVIGTSRGMGFAGSVKRHHFGRGPMAHGSKSHRLPGSIGAGTTPGHIVKGKRMAGHMGAERVTQKNIKIIKVDDEKKQLLLKGSVPGVDGGLLIIEKL